jgi:hypothetical protein
MKYILILGNEFEVMFARFNFIDGFFIDDRKLAGGVHFPQSAAYRIQLGELRSFLLSYPAHRVDPGDDIILESSTYRRSRQQPSHYGLHCPKWHFYRKFSLMLVVEFDIRLSPPVG